MRQIFWGFCRNLVPHRSLTIPFKPFRFWFQFHGDIHNQKRMFNRKLEESGSRHGESGSRYSNFFEFSINFLNFKWLNQPFKKSIGKKEAWDVMYYHHLFI